MTSEATAEAITSFDSPEKVHQAIRNEKYLKHVADALHMDDPEYQWSPDTISEVHAVMVQWKIQD